MLLELTQVLALAAYAPGADAAPLAPGPEPIVVTASRTTQGPTSGVAIVDSAEIGRMQPASLLEVLDDLAGIRAFSTGGIGGGSFLSIRGGEPNFTLVLVDGIKVNDPTNSRGGAFDFLAIDPSLVAQVEVARDAVSAIHGSDALSGVVNIRLRAPSAGETGPMLRAQTGSRGDVDLGLGFRGAWQGGGLLLSGSWFDSDGLDPGSTLERRQGLARLDQRLGGFEARLIGLYADADRSGFPEDSGGRLLAINRERETHDLEMRLVGLTLRRSTGATVRPNLSLSYSRQTDLSATPAIAPGVLDGVPAFTADTSFSRFEAVGDVGVHRGPLSATLGLAWQRESGRSDGTIDVGFPLPTRFDEVRTTRSLFAEATVRPAAGLELNFAGRHDRVADGPHASTGRAAISWQPGGGGPRLFARIGNGYKLPSLFALGHPLIGNPALRPERSRNLEAGIDWRDPAGNAARLTFFDNRFRDLIDFDPVSFTLVNRDRVGVQGAELEGHVAIGPRIGLSAALTWLDLDSPTPLRGRPQWQGSVHAVWQVQDGLELSTAVRANSDFNDSSIPTGFVVTGGHAEWDLGLRYQLSPELGLEAALRNLTDSRHQDAVGFPAPGRLVRLSLTGAF